MPLVGDDLVRAVEGEVEEGCFGWWRYLPI